jgi:hypothetical protein
MEFQSTDSQTLGDGSPDSLRLCFGPAMHYRIIGIALKPQMLVMCPHPTIESVMKKQIRQQGTDDATLRSAFDTLGQSSTRILCRRFEPAFDVEQYPGIPSVLAHQPQ